MSTFALAPVQGSHSTMSAKGKKATSLERQLLARSGHLQSRDGALVPMPEVPNARETVPCERISAQSCQFQATRETIRIR